MFARHHYLSGQLAPGASCYLAVWDGQGVRAEITESCASVHSGPKQGVQSSGSFWYVQGAAAHVSLALFVDEGGDDAGRPELDTHDIGENRRALSKSNPQRILSAFWLPTEPEPTKFWIITEHDRSVTTCLLPSEY